MRRNLIASLAGSSLLVLASGLAAQAQTTAAASSNGSTEEIVVTARRKAENIQDVPVVVNAVTSKTLENLNIRQFTDITAVVPGLTLTPAVSTGGTAVLRGVNFDENISGGSNTVNFYINDEPVTPDFAFESLFDIQQIEVLRGPQGTLRGTPSPSGSISMTTRRPDMEKYGGYVEGTVNNLGGTNLNAAVNIPIVQDKLAVRIAGLFADDESTRVHSINNPTIEPFSRQRGVRASVKLDPTDNLDIVGTYQHFVNDQTTFDAVESANIADPTQPASPVLITPGDREAVEELPRVKNEKTDDYNLQAQYEFAGQKLNYVFGYGEAHFYVYQPSDIGDFFAGLPGNPASPNQPGNTGFATTPNTQNGGSFTFTPEYIVSHEIRLSSAEPIFGKIDYVVGALFNRLGGNTRDWQETPVFFGPLSPTTGMIYSISRINQDSSTNERSFFGNATYHITSQDEISGGVRAERFLDRSSTFLSLPTSGFYLGTPINETFHPWIYSASIKHRFNDDLMVYASTGTSWRVSANTNPLFDQGDTFAYGNLLALYNLPPETSKSYEVGVKSDWLDRTVTLNVTGFYQTFKNFYLTDFNILRAERTAIAPGGSTTSANPGDTFALGRIGFLGVPVPVRVDGVEGEFGWQPTPRFSINGTIAYSSSKIQNGSVPCNPAVTPATGAALVAEAGGQQFLSCTVNYRAGFNSPFSATATAEYSHPVTSDVDGFIRGLLKFQGYSENDPSNPFDNIPAYATLNLYVGIRNPDGAWEITAYAKDINNAQRVLTTGSSPYTANYNVLATGVLGTSTYRAITTTPPREFGITAKYAFGSR